ncbi:hypothetical protein PFISCL1PPCAC_2508, partial [Pristionchus fissidentatus]
EQATEVTTVTIEGELKNEGGKEKKKEQSERSKRREQKRKTEWTEEEWKGRCQHIVVKKNRRCKMLTKPDKRYCGEHAVFEPQDGSRVRCPLDPRHTVLVSELEQHVEKKCNSRYVETEQTKKNMNAVEGETRFDDKIDYRPSDEEIRFVIDILDAYSDLLTSSVQDSIPSTTIDGVEKHLSVNEDMGSEKRKHLKQINNIVDNMSSFGLLGNDATRCICDLGAGKAQLTYFAALAAPSNRYLVVDRMGSRNKWDNRLKKEKPDTSIDRIRCSIEHLDLKKVQQLEGVDSVVGLCKHLCGSGTDAGVRCMMRLMEEGDEEKKKGAEEEEKKSKRRLEGLVLAPCCAHKARYAEYMGGPFLSSQLGISTNEHFAALRHVASWAICGLEVEKEDDGDEEGKWSSSWKFAHGRLAKAAIELGRASAIGEKGFSVKVVRYVEDTVSPENLLILAKRL